MRFIMHTDGGEPIAEVEAEGTVIQGVDDFLDLMANAGARNLVLRRDHFPPDFFRLSTGFAGEILQKVSNYGMRLAVLGDFSAYASSALRDFIYESNRTGQVVFVSNLEEALGRLREPTDS